MKNKIQNILIFLMVSIILFIVVEGLTRYLWRSNRLEVRNCNSTTGYGLKPNLDLRYHYNRLSGGAIKTNSRGLRDDEYDYTKTDDIKRVLLVGDSFMNALEVEKEETSEYFLEDFLNQDTDSSVQVINTGVLGWGTDQEYIFLKNEGLKYNPDIVVLFFYFNDVFETHDDIIGLDCPKPLFALNEQGDLMYYSAEETQKTEMIELSKKQSGLTFKEKIKYFLKKSRFFRQIEQFIFVVRPIQDLFVALQLREEDRYIQQDIKIYHPSFDWNEYWSLTEKIIKEISNEVSKAGAKFLIVQIPPMSTYDLDYLNHILYIRHLENELEMGNFDFEKINNAFENLALSTSTINYLDLTPHFKKNSDKNLTLYPLDKHLSPEGHRLTAEIVSKYLLENYFKNSNEN